jgi:GTP 3',8-cyclase
MPEAEYRWLPRAEVLQFEELERLCSLFTHAGVDRVRLTGGEPLLRRDLHVLVRALAALPGVRDLALTTNGLLLAEQAAALRAAGLRRVTVSLDTLRPERFTALTRRDAHAAVLAGIDAARAAGLGDDLKIDAVVLRGVNDDELVALLDHGRTVGAEVRFIEYMDVGGATAWRPEAVVSRAEMLASIAAARGEARPLGERGAAPAERFELADGTTFGIIASTTVPFCRACDRSRVTADGVWYHCLYAAHGIDLKTPLRSGASDEDIVALLRNRWTAREDRGAELRAGLADRGKLVPVEALRRDPHLEMHTRGG